MSETIDRSPRGIAMRATHDLEESERAAKCALERSEQAAERYLDAVLDRFTRVRPMCRQARPHVDCDTSGTVTLTGRRWRIDLMLRAAARLDEAADALGYERFKDLTSEVRRATTSGVRVDITANSPQVLEVIETLAAETRS
jgi:hypothetical protein